MELRGRSEGPSVDVAGLACMLVEKRRDGRIKLCVIQRGLEYRRAHPQLFLQGDYIALEVQGDRASHV